MIEWDYPSQWEDVKKKFLIEDEYDMWGNKLDWKATGPKEMYDVVLLLIRYVEYLEGRVDNG